MCSSTYRHHAYSSADPCNSLGSDLVVPSTVWTTSIYGVVSRWIHPDSTCLQTRNVAEKVLKQEVAWATHLSIQAVVLPFPKTTDCSNYARILNQLAIQAQYLQFWIQTPTTMASSENSWKVKSCQVSVANDNFCMDRFGTVCVLCVTLIPKFVLS